MVKIRLSRSGGKKNPFYHLTVTDSRNRRDGSYIERVGYYNPVAKGGDVPLKIETDRVEYWLGHGAQATDRVASLLKRYQKEGSTVARDAAPVVKKVTKAAPPVVEETPPAVEEGSPAA
ncbi:MAG: 30S ribosomal protein S16 [Gammaproteobacteria bacterium]|nr:30S ribosomal protein S16 [Gammaproteobacteria bacterium]